MLLYSSGKMSRYLSADKIFDRVKTDKNFSFSKYTTYGVGGRARGAFFPESIAEAKAVFKKLSEEGENFFILGDGSNILASDKGYDGFVICTKLLRGIYKFNGSLFCLSGTSVGSLMTYCVKNGFTGLEYLSGIPATIGGIAFMNGGAGGVYINSNIISVKLFDGKEYNLSNKNCKFAYKHSTMRDINALILGVFLSVSASSPEIVRMNICKRLENRGHLPSGRSCGCVFKNIIPKDGKLISAGKIIEDCNLAGYGGERVYVSPKHCNFIINNGATAAEIYDVICTVKRIVDDRCGIKLEEEVVFVGDFS